MKNIRGVVWLSDPTPRFKLISF